MVKCVNWIVSELFVVHTVHRTAGQANSVESTLCRHCTHCVECWVFRAHCVHIVHIVYTPRRVKASVWCFHNNGSGAALSSGILGLSPYSTLYTLQFSFFFLHYAIIIIHSTCIHSTYIHSTYKHSIYIPSTLFTTLYNLDSALYTLHYLYIFCIYTFLTLNLTLYSTIQCRINLASIETIL